MLRPNSFYFLAHPAKPRRPKASINPPGAPVVLGSSAQPTTRRPGSTGPIATAGPLKYPSHLVATAGGLTYPQAPKPKAPKPTATVVGDAPRMPIPPPTPEAMPWDSKYLHAVSEANTGYENTMTDLTNTEAGIKQDYGIEDLTNPFSRAKLLQQSFDRSKRTANNSYAAAGQLYGGSLQNAQNTNNRNFVQGTDSLERAYQAALADIARRRRNATGDRDDAITNAGDDRLQAALDGRPDPTVIPPGTNPPSPAAVGTAAGSTAAAVGAGTVLGNAAGTLAGSLAKPKKPKRPRPKKPKH